MKNYNPRHKSYDREDPKRESDGFNREDSNRNTHTDTGYLQFAKDKRVRTRRVEKISRTEKPDRTQPHEESHQNSEKRHSFNPNFTKDNRRINNGGSDSARKSDYKSDRHESSETNHRHSSDKHSRGSYGSKSHDKRQSQSSPYKNNKPGKSYQGENYPKYPAPKFDEAIRLNRYLATSGICSRREADNFISAGLVTVNGQVVTELGTKVLPTDIVKFNDSIVRSEKKIYILMNKPKGYVTTLEDPHADKTVMEIIKNACTERVYPVGRLDKNSVGVLLFTNDGDLTKRLTHPAYNKKKVYQVSLDKPLTKADMTQIAEGIELEDGEIHADEISYVKENKREVGIEIHSGRNRIVRRIFEHLGYKVQKLDRVYFAGLTKKGLKRGGWRFLTPKEVEMLKSGKYE